MVLEDPLELCHHHPSPGHQ
uniref:Uncharacterized protein n=1 Tax=Anguilla anguilla TaxID=7936 RepID=A0A0E9V3V1_ANGAN